MGHSVETAPPASRVQRGILFFRIILITQLAHFAEHVFQVIQIHLAKVPPPEAHGLAGIFFDTEWLHLVFNSWVLAGVVCLLYRFRDNGVLWALLAVALWHEVEHLYIISVYVSRGMAGDPGLLARGGLLWGGLPISRPDLHFLYNLAETVGLVLAFRIQTRSDPGRSVDRLPEQNLLEPA